ncbi:replication regulatory protein RepA [Hafnia alvei]|jgi:hypothetical protein|uniref:replication regulatory protein RepA n=1 Tax=Hafnia alvei TaxID=569 RepID=UPI00345E366D
MSQSTNAETSSSKTKRSYRKGHPLSVGERKLRSVSRKKETHKSVSIFIRNAHKDKLDEFCDEYGLTQAEMIEVLIEREEERRK